MPCNSFQYSLLSFESNRVLIKFLLSEKIFFLKFTYKSLNLLRPLGLVLIIFFIPFPNSRENLVLTQLSLDLRVKVVNGFGSIVEGSPITRHNQSMTIFNMK